jgi:hypothetical protein
MWWELAIDVLSLRPLAFTLRALAPSDSRPLDGRRSICLS